MTQELLTRPEVLEPRVYQVTSLDALREALHQGHRRVILCAPTGSGKTEMAIYLIQEARAKGKKVAFVCDRRDLVDQTSARLTKYGIPHGIAMADDTEGRREPIQVCSAHTIEKREYWDDVDLIVIDECHAIRKKIIKFAVEWGGPVIGLSATPMTDGLSKVYSHVVNAVTTDELLKEGWLSPLRIYAAKEIDMAGAKKTAGEWQKSEVRKRGHQIIGDMVSEWVKHTMEHFGGPVKTLVFSADVAHGEDICRVFQAAGYDFRQSTFRDGDYETRQLVKAFRKGEFTGLVSVEKFVKGFDVPDVMCMIGARPYSSSLAAVIQQLGRGMRTAEGKDYCLYLDHAGNMAGWYEDVCDIWAKGVEQLPDPKKKQTKTRREGYQRADVACYSCGFICPPGTVDCPACGAARGRRQTSATTVPGRMNEVTRSGSREWIKDVRWTWQQVCRISLDRWDGDKHQAQKTAAGYYKGIYGQWPQNRVFDPCDGQADERVRRTVKANLIKYWKVKEKKKEKRDDRQSSNLGTPGADGTPPSRGLHPGDGDIWSAVSTD